MSVSTQPFIDDPATQSDPYFNARRPIAFHEEGKVGALSRLFWGHFLVEIDDQTGEMTIIEEKKV